MITALNLRGLSSLEVEERLRKYGVNQIPEKQQRWLLIFLSKFWGLIPWMLEVTMILQFALGKTVDGAIIAVLLVVNAIISYGYERRAKNALALLKQRLTIQTRVLRDGMWHLIPAEKLVPGDIVRLRVGDIVPADVRLIDGKMAVDQSTLTGESDLVELAEGDSAYAASVIRRGEGIAEVISTGARTSFSKTANLIQTATSTQHGENFVQKIVTQLMILTGILVAGVLLYAYNTAIPFSEVLLFTLALLIAAIPVSLPVTFTLATAIGARELARFGVLATRLPAIKEAAGMNVLCCDKTGTITKNELTLVGVYPFNEYTEDDVLRLAALASDEATHDPIDVAIVSAARERSLDMNGFQRIEFTPFDPATKRTEALLAHGEKQTRVMKGACHVIGQLVNVDFEAEVENRAGGHRCIAVAAGGDMAGILVLQDPPRADASLMVRRLQDLGVRVLMISGDSLTTARAVARQVGIMGRACALEDSDEDFDSRSFHFDVFAKVYPEDKYKLVRALQKNGHVVGMTGDGINDAPAIRQAEIGIAVNTATDITKSAASLVLTGPGLKDMLAAVEVGRSIFQRISTYTLNKIIKTIHMGLFLSLGLVLTGGLIVPPTYILLVVLANDLVSMALTTDRVHPSPRPNRWRVGPMVASGVALSLAWVAFSFAVYFIGRDGLMLNPAQLQTLIFLMLVVVAQANVYLIRERRFFWCSRPSQWMLLATVFDLVVVGFLAINGILMTALSPIIILQLFAVTILFTIALDFLKVGTFYAFDLR
jgi:H+-transporting ATPase